MRDIDTIDTELWLIAAVRAACRRDGEPLPNMARADELLDERLRADLCGPSERPAPVG